MRTPPVDLAPFGLAVGHAADAEGATGCTVVRGVDRALRGAVAVVGRATGTRELAALGRPVKEMIGGFEYWERDGHAVERGVPALA